MFSADPDNPVTIYTVIVSLLIAIMIYYLFHSKNEIIDVFDGGKKIQDDEMRKKALKEDPTIINKNVPIITSNEYNKIYTASTLKRNTIRINNLINSFNQKFNNFSPDFIVRSPGRVNLIGEHIDYCGYDVLPMAVEKDVLFAVKMIDNKKEENIIKLCNIESKFTAIEINLQNSDDTKIKLGVDNRHWSIYFLAAYHGVIENYKDNIDFNHFKSLRIMVDGNIPKGSGLSSSSAFVCGSAVCLLYSNLKFNVFNGINKSDIASFCIKCEQYVGVMSGGMDQTICMTANKGYAKHISFIPSLNAVNVKLPDSNKVKWVISNCLLEHKLQDESGTQNYNTRVVECRLAALLLAKLLGVNKWRDIKTFRDIQDDTNMKLDDLLFKTMDLLNDQPYSIQDIEDDLDCKDLKITLEDLMGGLKRGPVVIANLRKLQDKYKLPLQQRALHVYGEANRVLNFRRICMESSDDFDDEKDDNTENKMLNKLGKLMTDSHISCRDKYECSCEKLDELQSLCIDGGALGSRLTGAGWGGCCVSLVKNNNVNKFKTYLNKNYYASIPKVPLNHLFITSPSASLTIIKIVNDD